MTQRALFPRRVTREELNSLVDRAADLIRTAVDYKFILVLLFLKRLNDLWRFEKRQAVQRLVREAGLSEEEADREVYHAFNIPRQYLWDEVTKSVRDLPEKLATAISEVAKLNKELQGVINRVDFLEFARNQENRELLRQLVELFNKYDLGGEEVSPDILGDAYEHILMRFAPEKAKEGEIYTPREVIRLMKHGLRPILHLRKIFAFKVMQKRGILLNYKRDTLHVADEYIRKEFNNIPKNLSCASSRFSHSQI